MLSEPARSMFSNSIIWLKSDRLLETKFRAGIGRTPLAEVRRNAQAIARHSTIDLTMNVCTDPHLLDVSGAVASLPDFTKARLEKPFASKDSGSILY